MSKAAYTVFNPTRQTFFFQNGDSIAFQETKTLTVEQDSIDDDLINNLILNDQLILRNASGKRNAYAPDFNDAERTALQYFISDPPITGITYDNNNPKRIVGFTEGSTPFTITYNSNSIVVTGGGKTMTVALDGAGLPTGITYS